MAGALKVLDLIERGVREIAEHTTAVFGAEDFAFLLQEMPGCYVFIGNGSDNQRGDLDQVGSCNLHNPRYDFNDSLLPLGMYWVRLTETFLRIGG